MEIKIVQFLAEPVGSLWKELQYEITSSKEEFYVSSPLSSTPLPVYNWIIENSNSFQNWDKVKFVLMDEQVEGASYPFHYVDVNDPASYEGFANKHLLSPLANKLGYSIPVIKPTLEEINQFNINKPIDLLILALGVKGNYANIMPHTDKSTSWHIAHLIPEFRTAHTQAGSNSYEGARFREYGMSLGPKQVIEAKNIVVLLSGEKKRELVSELFSYDQYNPKFPLSIIYEPEVRDRVTIFITQELADIISLKL